MHAGWLLTLAMAQGPVNTEALDPWIRQLGSRQFREREAASQHLLGQCNVSTIAALQRAASGPDSEVRRRAEALLPILERTLLTQQVLQPTRLRLNVQDVPVTEAIAHLAKKAGINLTIDEAARPALNANHITLDTGETTAWDALRQLTEKAGLVERPPLPARPPDLMINEGRRRRVVWINADNVPPSAPESFVLTVGKERLPVGIAGALRVRLVGKPGKDNQTIVLPLAVDVETRLGWNQLVALRVDRALDETGRALEVLEMHRGEPARLVGPAEDTIILWDGLTELPRAASRQGSVKLKAASGAAKVIRELQGTVIAEIDAPSGPLVTVDNVFQAEGKSFAGLDGSRVKVMEARREAEGDYRLKLEVQLPASASPLGALPGNVVFVNRGPVPAQGTINLTAMEANQKGLSLLDDQGRALPLSTGYYVRPNQPGAPLTYSLIYQRRKDQGEPSKFVFSGRRGVLIEMPFTLRDVPLQ